MKEYSSILWIQNLRNEWNHAKLKWVANIYAGGTPNTNIDEYWEDGTIPWLNSGSVNQKRITIPSNYITEVGLSNSSTRWVPKGAILMALAGQGKTKGTVALLDIDATCNQSMAAIVPNEEKINNVYLFYWLEVNYERIRGLAGTELRDGLNLEILGDIFCPLPNINEQKLIALYLDHQCTIIDNLISKKEHLMELLQELRQAAINEAVTKGLDPNVKLKSSGFDWIGDVPMKWELKKLKYLSKINNRALLESTDPEFEFGYLDISSVTSNGVISSIQKMKFKDSPSRARRKVTEGCTIFSTVRTYLKAIAYIDKNVHNKESEEIIVSTGFAVVEPGVLIIPELLFYILRSDRVVNRVEAISTGVSYPAINSSNLADIVISFPKSKEEQSRIVMHVKEQLEKIAKIEDAINIQIDKLKDYRQSFISEAVTGKIDVWEWQPSN